MPRLTVLVVMLAVVGLLGVGSLNRATSQEAASPTADGQATPAGDVAGFEGQPLGKYYSELAPEMAQVLQRHIFEPGGRVGPHIRPGETIYHLESGTLRFTLLDGVAHVRHFPVGTPDATPTANEPITIGTEITLNAGDTLFFDESALQSVRNDSDEIAVALVANLRGGTEPARRFLEQIATPIAGTPVP